MAKALLALFSAEGGGRGEFDTIFFHTDLRNIINIGQINLLIEKKRLVRARGDRPINTPLASGRRRNCKKTGQKCTRTEH